MERDLSAMTRVHSCFHDAIRTLGLSMTLDMVLVIPCQMRDKSRRLKM